MNLSSALMLLQAISSLATIFAVVFVLFQLRLLKRNMEAQGVRGALHSEHSIWSAALYHPEIAPDLVRRIVVPKDSELSGRDALFIAMIFDQHQSLFREYRSRVVPYHLWRGLDDFFLRILKEPEVREMWEDRLSYYPTDFVKHVEARRVSNEEFYN